MALKIDEMFAFVAEEKNGDEGLIGFNTATGWMPMVGADMTRVESLYPIAEEISRMSGRPFKLLKFSCREDITELAKPVSNETKKC